MAIDRLCSGGAMPECRLVETLLREPTLELVASWRIPTEIPQ